MTQQIDYKQIKNVPASSSGTPTTVITNFVIPASQQMVFMRKPVITNGMKITISNDSAMCIL